MSWVVLVSLRDRFRVVAEKMLRVVDPRGVSGLREIRFGDVAVFEDDYIEFDVLLEDRSRSFRLLCASSRVSSDVLKVYASYSWVASGGRVRFFREVYGLLHVDRVFEVLKKLDLYVRVHYVFNTSLLNLYTDEEGMKSLVSILDDIDVVMQGEYKVVMDNDKVEDFVLSSRACMVLEFFPENILAAHFITRVAEIEYQDKGCNIVSAEEKVFLDLSREKGRRLVVVRIPVKNTSIYALVPEELTKEIHRHGEIK